MIFFTLGQHHDFAVIAIGADAAGTHQVAFRVGDIDALREAKARLEHYQATELASQAYVEGLPFWVNIWRGWMFFIFTFSTLRLHSYPR